MNIISFDNEKVFKTIENGIQIINKKTTPNEVENLKKAREYINSKKVTIDNCNYSITIPKIQNWNDENNLVKMDCFEGNNLEEMIRSKSTRKRAIMILNALLEFILINDFYWIDFSPRNILINDSNKKICFVDFEKGLNFENENLIIFFRNHVYEEYSSFLFLNERILNGEEIFKLQTNEKNVSINVDDIKIKRVKATAKKIYLHNIITQNQFLKIYRMFLIAELPKIINNNLVFPRIELEEILETKKENPLAYEQYAQKIIQLVKSNKKEKKTHY